MFDNTKEVQIISISVVCSKVLQMKKNQMMWDKYN
jgi:hypothetical protein